MIGRLRSLALVLTALLAACAPQSAPIPADSDPATLKAWAKRHAPEGDRWRFVAMADDAALYLDRRIEARTYPLIRYRMKFEHFAPGRADNHVFRSAALTYEVDCARMRHRITEVRAFEALGLTGPSFLGANPAPDWGEAQIGAHGYTLSAMACTLAQPAVYDLDDPRLMPFQAAGYSPDEIAAEVWVKTHRLAEPPWTYLGSGRETAFFLSDRNFDFRGYPLIRFDAKAEFFHPRGGAAAMSQVRRVELDCDRKRHRDLSVQDHAGLNLTGPVVVARGAGAWVQEAAALPIQEAMACIFAHDLRNRFAADPDAATGQDLF